MHNTDFFRLAMYGYVVVTLLYIVYVVFKNRTVGLAATGITVLAFVLHTIAFGLRWKESYDQGIGHIPLSNMYESMVFFAWSIILIYLFFEWKYNARALGAVVAPLAALTVASVSLSPYISQEIEPLVPALQSNWLTVHVITSFFGYAAFAVSFGVSVIYLLLTSEAMKEISFWAGRIAIPVVIAVTSVAVRGGLGKTLILATAGVLFLLMLYFGGPARAKVAELFPPVKTLDDLNYRSIMVGFPLLTIGIITGAAWANYAWGTYWSWDPKETWSLITWFVYAAFLHARFTAGWRGKRSALLAIIGFGAVIFTYIGVNFLLSGLHSYA
jgi:cytochrome c-type biogenesis protein CcsB